MLKFDNPFEQQYSKLPEYISVCAEANPDFVEEVGGVAKRGQAVILICNLGGSLDPDYQPSKFGMQSRCDKICCIDSDLFLRDRTPWRTCRS